MSIKVMLAAGGSGGHIFPSVALCSELEKKGVNDIYFISSRRKLDMNMLKDVRHRCFHLSVNPMPRRFRFFKILKFIFKFTGDMIHSIALVIKMRPDIVVGFGGYSSGAIVSVAGLLRIPVIIHEQNYEPGRANKILCRFADCVVTSFNGSERFFPGRKKNIFCCGNPLRSEMLKGTKEEAVEKLGVIPDVPAVLIMGGSQGSSFLNRTATEAALQVSEKFEGNVQYIHLTGSVDFDDVKEFYETKGLNAVVYSFLDRIDLAYAAADVAVSRSGAAAVFELAYYGKAMILVPYPNPKNNQRSNAEYFESRGAAVYRDEKRLSASVLSGELFDILADDEKRRRLSFSAERLSRPAAARFFADKVLEVVSGKKGRSV